MQAVNWLFKGGAVNNTCWVTTLLLQKYALPSFFLYHAIQDNQKVSILIWLEMYWTAFLSTDYPVRLDLVCSFFLFSSIERSGISVFGWFSGYFSSCPIVSMEIPEVFCFYWSILLTHHKFQCSSSAAFVPSVVLTGSFFNSPCSPMRFS